MAFPTLAEALFQPGGEKTVQTGNDHRELMVTLACQIEALIWPIFQKIS